MRRLAYAAIGWELLDLLSFAIMVTLGGAANETNGLVRGMLDIDPLLVVGVKAGLVIGLVVLLGLFDGADWRGRLTIKAAFTIGALAGLVGTLANVVTIARNLLTAGAG